MPDSSKGGTSWQASDHGAQDFQMQGPTRTVSGALWLPANPAPSTPLVLMGHGASGDRFQAPIPHLARRFLESAGMAVMAIDGPVHGLRQVGEGGRSAFAEEMKRPACIDDMVADWLAALAMVRAERDIGQGKLGYFGLSMGTMFGIPLLASSEPFSAAALGLCGITGAGSTMAQRLTSDAQQIAHPVLFLMQLQDELFPRDGYLSLFDELAAQDKRLHANPGLHPEVPAEEIDFAFEFLSTRLLGTVERRVVNPLAD